MSNVIRTNVATQSASRASRREPFVARERPRARANARPIGDGEDGEASGAGGFV